MCSVAPLLSLAGGPRVLVFDPGLINSVGHHREFASIIKQELGGDHRIAFYANFKADYGVIFDFLARPVFYDDIYTSPDLRGSFADIYAGMSRALVAGLGRIDPADLRTDAIALMHTATIFQLGGLAAWYAALQPSRRPRLFIQFQFPLAFHVPSASDVPAALRAARDAAQRLVAASTGVRFASNARTLSREIAEQLGVPCETVPLPIRWPTEPRSADAGGQVDFGFFGGLRTEKGAAILAGALPIFLSRHPGVRVLVHAPYGPSDEASVERLSALPQIEMLRTSFGDKASYYAQLRRARCVLVPYDPVAYAIRTSGIVIEALGLDKAVITTDHTWLADEVRRWGGDGFFMNAFTSAALVEALESAIAAFDNPAGRARRVRPGLRDEYSPRGFCDAVLRIMQDAASTDVSAAASRA